MTSFLIVFGIVVLACQSDQNGRTLKLQSGKTVTISFDEQKANEKVTKIAIDAVTTEKLKTDDELEKDIKEIWESVREKVESKDLDEAIVRYQYTADYVDANNDPEKVFVVSVFLAEKIENGTWKIDKIG